MRIRRAKPRHQTDAACNRQCRLDWSGFLLMAAVLFLPAGGLAAEKPPQTPPPATYLRIDESSTNEVRLQTALRRLVPVQGGGPTIWLGAVTHIGTTNYFREYTRLLATNDIVLFEAVLPHRRGGWTGAEFARMRQPAAQGANLQTDLARALQLAFQLETVDYSPTNFLNSDLSMEAVQGLMLAGMRQAADKKKAEPEPDGEAAANGFNQLMDLMQGRGFIGRLVKYGVQLIAADPQLRATTRLTFIEVLGSLKGDLAKAQALPPEMSDLLKVLIHRRNQKVTRDLRKTLLQPNPPASVAVFYGAGHMADLERRVCQQLDYRPDGDVWLTAFGVDLVQFGITRWERELIRFMTRRQMKMLNSAEHDE